MTDAASHEPSQPSGSTWPLVIAAVIGWLMLAGLAIVSRPGGAPSVTHPACAPQETFTEVRYRDFTPTAVVVTRPCGDRADRPYVVFASYIALVDGDYYSGPRPERAVLTPRDDDHFLFGSLARRLAREGIASVRYDPIGIRSRPREGHGFQGATVAEEDLLRIGRADFSGLLAAVVSRADEVLGRTSRAPIVFVGHSGGAFTVGDYLERARAEIRRQAEVFRTYGFVGVSGWVSRPTDLTEQSKWRYWVRKLQVCLRDSPPRECRDRLKAHPQYVDALWDSHVRARVEALFDQDIGAAELTRQFDRELSELPRRVEASKRRNEGVAFLNRTYRINQQVLKDLHFGPPSALPLSCNTLAAALIFGEQDFVLDPQLQTEAWTQACGRASDITVLPGLGHTLGLDSYYGPPSPQALETVVRAIATVAGGLASGPLTQPSSSTSPPASPSSSPPSTGTRR